MTWASKLIKKLGYNIAVDILRLAVLEKNKEIIEKLTSRVGIAEREKKGLFFYRELHTLEARAFRELVSAVEKVKTK